LVIYYSICLILACLNLMICILFSVEKKINNLFVALALIMTLANFGYLSLALSTTLEGALFANKISYLGGCFISPIVLFLILRVCNYKFPNWLRFLLYGFSFFVYLLVLSTGFYSIYYKDVWIDKYYDSTILLHTNTPLYYLSSFLIVGYLIANLSILIYVIIKNKNVAKMPLIVLISLEVINILMFFIGKLIIPEFEFMPAVYVLTGLILLYLKKSLDLYDIEDTVELFYDKNNNNGYLIFDQRLYYLGSNDIMKNILDLTNCTIDKNIKDLSTLSFINDWICIYLNDPSINKFNYDINNKHYTITINPINENKTNRGYIIEFLDETDRINYLNLLNQYNEKLEQDVTEKSNHILSIQHQVVLGMANIVENRDNSTGGHVKRTSEVIKILLDTIIENNIFNIDATFYNHVVRAAPLHDLGKIAIDDDILRKPGRFTPEEFEIMKTHAAKSAELVSELLGKVETKEFISIAINIARHHHEKWNGMGYPDGLKGMEIPLEARIMAIADVYDALVSKRCYKDSMSFDKAYEVMMESMGSHFDPYMEKVFVLSKNNLKNYYKNNQ